MSRKSDYLTRVDKTIGDKIYSLRLSMGLSRMDLVDKIGVTHQQLQKYEKGSNRISVGRLLLIAQVLNKNIEYFYEDLDGVNKIAPVSSMAESLCIEVSRNFMRITNPKIQASVNTLIKSLVKIE